MEFLCRIQKDGGLDFGERNGAYLKRFRAENPGIVLRITPVLPESNKQRAFYHGAVLPLWAYLDGSDYRNSDVLAQLHEVAKLEFNTEHVVVNGIVHKIGRSTKGREVLGPFLGRVLEWLVENYAIEPALVLDPAITRSSSTPSTCTAGLKPTSSIWLPRGDYRLSQMRELALSLV